ncbi:hypothetical protein ACWCSH_03615 [Streptosporangium sp. NPDC001682]
MIFHAGDVDFEFPDVEEAAALGLDELGAPVLARGRIGAVVVGCLDGSSSTLEASRFPYACSVTDYLTE